MFDSQFQALSSFVVLIWIVSAVVHFTFSVAVLFDGLALVENARRSDEKASGTALVHPRFWALAVIVGGVFVAAVYWLMHHSTLVVKDRTEEIKGADVPAEL